VVIIIESFIGVILGGISGYFGKWIDMLIMRAVDVINCIPTLPLYLILGAVMDGIQLDPRTRIYILMLLMGFMSWPGVARVARAQILSLREQEFMVAAEANGIRASRRIFKHLVPNVMPQLIVLATMGLGDVILSESVLSFLGLGVKYPLASWGNILNSVNDMHVMTNYLNVWIPAGFMILVTVLGFNFAGDGLRDAFDPKMKR
jgi:peptide/nickel transport system permease protein